ncbi:MAG: hypothetical protein SFV32_09780 [Opitutaceae bacterium]|nr:hypothetical protein [Opitutaceae bacterium]
MDEQTAPENPAKDFNKIDLSQLQGFSFGTQWTQDKASKDRGDKRDGDRRESTEPRRDRRAFKRPAGGPGEAGAAAPAPGGTEGGDRPPRQDRRGDFRGGPRREGGERFDRGERGERFDRGTRPPMQDRGPYISPTLNVTFYPDDSGFTALSKAIRSSCRTYELFEIAKVIIGKNDRFVAVVQRKPIEGADPQAKPAPFFLSVPDGVPFETEEAAVAHVVQAHLGQFFDSAEVEVEAPKGNFQVINRCTVTGELLGPPNYHRYNQIVAQHHAARINRMSLEAYRTRIETVRDPEVVTQWLEKMKKTTRYTWKLIAEGEVAPAFDGLEEARTFLLGKAKDKVVRPVEHVRFAGKSLESLPQGEIRRAIEGTLERQRRFPLDTANALRGRLRREGFTIFKKGSKGVSYVCAVKRKFRVPGQTFSDSIGGLIAFIEANPMVKASELPSKFLGLTPPPVAPVAVVEGESAPPVVPTAPTHLSAEENAKLNRMHGDLRWLVTEGYVTEFIDGRLFAPPAMTEARKQEVEKSEHDPENFPEAPQAPAAAPAPAAETPEAQTPPPAES